MRARVLRFWKGIRRHGIEAIILLSIFLLSLGFGIGFAGSFGDVHNAADGVGACGGGGEVSLIAVGASAE